MKKALYLTGKAIGVMGKLAVKVVIMTVHCIMNCIGALICAVTD